MIKQLARIKGVHFGVGDYGSVCMWFSTYIDEHSAALQVLAVPEAVQLIQDAGAKDVHDLEGKNCWVKVQGNLIVYDGYAKI